MKNFKAFTAEFTGRTPVIMTDCEISAPVDTKKYNPEDVQKLKVIALWDTGATNCVIKPSIAKKLGLFPITKAMVNHAGGSSAQNVYLIHLFLPNDVALPFLKVTECDEKSGKFDIIIGMDVISQSDFSITNADGKTKFSFRMPSIEHVDYVAKAKVVKKLMHATGANKPGRNDPCPCGSGIKYKHCHGKGK